MQHNYGIEHFRNVNNEAVFGYQQSQEVDQIHGVSLNLNDD